MCQKLKAAQKKYYTNVCTLYALRLVDALITKCFVKKQRNGNSLLFLVLCKKASFLLFKFIVHAT